MEGPPHATTWGAHPSRIGTSLNDMLFQLSRLLLASALLAPATALAAPAPSPLVWAGATQDPFVDVSVADAFARAEKQSKLVCLFFHQESQPESRRMLRETFPDEALRTWLEANAVSILIDRDAKPELAARFDVNRTPVTQLRRADKSLIEVVAYFQSPVELLAACEAAVRGLTVNACPDGENARDPYAWLAWGNHLFNTGGNADEMARAYLWALDNGDGEAAGFRARNFEYLIKRLAYSRRSSPEAQWGLVQRRDQIEGLLATRTGTPRQAYELVRFNFWLREEERTSTALKDLILQRQSDAQSKLHEQEDLRVLGYHGLKRVVAYAEFGLVLKIFPDPVAEITRRLGLDADWRKAVAAAESEPGSDPAPAPLLVEGRPDSRARIVEDAADFYETLLSTGRGKDASNLLERVTADVSTGRAWSLFVQRADRVGLPDLARAIGSTALESVTKPGQRKHIERAVNSIEDR